MSAPRLKKEEKGQGISYYSNQEADEQRTFTTSR
jgi:hypothetical protein